MLVLTYTPEKKLSSTFNYLNVCFVYQVSPLFPPGATYAQKPGPKWGSDHSGVRGEATCLGATDGRAEAELCLTPTAGDLRKYTVTHVIMVWYSDTVKEVHATQADGREKLDFILVVHFCLEANVYTENM